MAIVNIRGLDKAELLRALYNASKPLGKGFLRATPGDMTREQALEVMGCGDDHAQDFGFRRGLSFDYVNGRVLKVDLGGDECDTGLFDRDNGEGAGQRAIETVRGKTRL